MVRHICLCWIGLSTINAFAPQGRARRKLSGITAVTRPHESHGIAKCATTIALAGLALAGLTWVGIVSGLPVIQPATAVTEERIEFTQPAAVATEAQIEFMAAATTTQKTVLTERIDGIVTTMGKWSSRHPARDCGNGRAE
jgi:hypothetical protein